MSPTFTNFPTMITIYTVGVALYITAYYEADPRKKKRLQLLAKLYPEVAPTNDKYIVEALMECLELALRDDWQPLLKQMKGVFHYKGEDLYVGVKQLFQWLRQCWKKTVKGTLKDDCLEVKGTDLHLSF